MSRREKRYEIDTIRTLQLGLDELDVLANCGDSLTFYVVPKVTLPIKCPYCGGEKANIHILRNRTLRDVLPDNKGMGKFIELHFQFKSYFCSNCQTTFTPNFCFASPKSRMTRRFEDFLVREAMSNSLESVSKTTNGIVSAAAIKSVIDRWIQAKDATRLPRYTAQTLCLLSYQNVQSYGLLVLNVEDGQAYLVDVLPEISSEAIRATLRKFELHRIRQIVVDLTEVIWDVLAEMPPHIDCLVDPGFLYSLAREELYAVAQKDARWLPMNNKLEVIMTPRSKILATQQYTLSQTLNRRPHLAEMYNATDSLYTILSTGWSKQRLLDWASSICTYGPGPIVAIAQRLLICLPNITKYGQTNFSAMYFSSIGEQISRYLQQLRPCSAALEKARLLYLLAPDTIQSEDSSTQLLGISVTRIFDMLKEQKCRQERIF